MWDVTPVLLCPSRNSDLDFREHRDLHRPCAIYRSIFLPDCHLCRRICRDSGFLVCRLLMALAGPGICSSSFLLYRNLERERGMSFAVVL